MIVSCQLPTCKVDFNTSPSKLKRGWGKFCSDPCSRAAHANDRYQRDDGYITINLPSHPRANKSGWVYEHIVVEERKLGRALKPKEVVHHRNENPSDNQPSNLRVFRNQAAHVRHHARERLLKQGIDPDREKQCSVCEVVKLKTEFSPSSSRGKPRRGSRCRPCAAKIAYKYR